MSLSEKHTEVGTKMDRPKGRALGVLLLGALVLGAICADGSVLLAGEPADSSRQGRGLDWLVWELTGAKVVKTGQSSTNARGMTLTGHAIEAAARATNGGRLSEAVFHLTLSAFCPRTDQPNLKAGRWQVRGTWVMRERSLDGISSPTNPIQPRPDSLRGYLLAEMDACPSAARAQFSAVAWASEACPPAPPKKYEGYFEGEGNFEGRLCLKLSGPK